MRLKIVLPFICTLPLFVAMAGAGLASRASVIRLTNTADTIVIASANATTVGGNVSATIHVEQVLKGLPRPGDTLSVVWTLPRGSWPLSGKAEFSNGHGLFSCWIPVGHGRLCLQQTAMRVGTIPISTRLQPFPRA